MHRFLIPSFEEYSNIMSVTVSQRMGGRVAMQRTANPRTWVQIPACAPIKSLQRMLFISIPYRNEAQYF